MGTALILGVGMLRFGKLLDLSVKDLAARALDSTLADAGVGRDQIQAVWFANSGWGFNGGQDCIRGQVALRPSGIGAVPIVNVENACAGGATALHGAWLSVQSGECDAVLAIGVEKLVQRERLRTFASFLGGMDVEALPRLIEQAKELRAQFPAPEPAHVERASHGRARNAGASRGRRNPAPALPKTLFDLLVIADHFRIDLRAMLRDAVKERLQRPMGRSPKGMNHSPFMDVYAIAARRHMAEFGSTQAQLAIIAAKNHDHGAKNPMAQIQQAMLPEQVLADKAVAYPLTRAMCAPLGDGAAAALVCSERFAKRVGAGRAVKLRASVIESGSSGDSREGITARASRRAYAAGGVGPEDLHLAEVHDATAFGELSQSEALGFCESGAGGVFAESGATRLGGRLPLNTSGGLESRGHPIAASGLAQICELVMQLRGEAGARQVQGARMALAQNGGGMLDGEEAAVGIHVLEA